MSALYGLILFLFIQWNKSIDDLLCVAVSHIFVNFKLYFTVNLRKLDLRRNVLARALHQYKSLITGRKSPEQE